jgi:two-component system NarL family response regulator
MSSAAISYESLRVLIADDHAPTRDDVRRAIAEAGGFTVCAEVADAAEAVMSAMREHPDICVLDIGMPGGGVAAAWEIAARLPDTRILMFTVSDADIDLFSALRAGAHGYLTKSPDMQELVKALRGISSGVPQIEPVLLGRIVERFRAGDPRRRRLAVDAALVERLTSREWEVLELLARDRSTVQIASDLCISKSAVRVHIAAIVRKLGVKDRRDAVASFRGRSEGR